ncbi:MAG: hypothetical protein B7X44_11110 [Halothiobacillus sp. 15-55-196]|nr:MAG: hypothetical protein B7X44_11110 [Halothiobacillus sp. 15-55-196]
MAWAVGRYSKLTLNPADSAGVNRTEEQRMAKGVMGMLAEGWMRSQIRDFAAKQEIVTFKFASSPPQLNTDGEFEQVDILVTKTKMVEGVEKSVELKVEVRSSFNYHSLNNAIFNGFSVLGPYGNSVKPGETLKDIYVFIAIDLHQKAAGDNLIVYTDGTKRFVDYSKTTTSVLLNHTFSISEGKATVRNGFDFVLVGGATADMFNDASLAEPLKKNAGYQNDDFRSIGIPKALDAVSILKRILAT